MADKETPQEQDQFENLEPRTHRRLLNFLNAARTHEDLAFAPQTGIPPQEAEPVLRRPSVSEQREPPEQLIPLDTAFQIMRARDQISPVQGFAHIDQLRGLIDKLNLGDFLNRLLG